MIKPKAYILSSGKINKDDKVNNKYIIQFYIYLLLKSHWIFKIQLNYYGCKIVDITNANRNDMNVM